MFELHRGDCLDVLRKLPAGSVDAVVTDPPAGIAFMGKEWDAFPTRDRGDLPGGSTPQQTAHKHGLGFARGITWDKSRKGRDGFVDFLTPRLAEARRVTKPGSYMLCWALPRTSHWTGLAIEDAGWVIRDRVSHLFGSGFPKAKSCLKPACEDWWLAWNPAKKTTPLNIDRCRVGSSKPGWKLTPGRMASTGLEGYGEREGRQGPSNKNSRCDPNSGRWPANVTHDGSPEVLAAFEAFGESASRAAKAETPRRFQTNTVYGKGLGTIGPGNTHTDTGTAARFFYCAKASKADRGEGNAHPTVKNTALMGWLIRLITPPGGVVLDLFAGSGSTGKAALLGGFRFVGMEQDHGYCRTARRRLRAAEKQAAAA